MPSPSCSRASPLDISLCPYIAPLLFFSPPIVVCAPPLPCTAMRPTVHTVSATNAEAMHWQRRTHRISSTYVLGNGRAAVNMSFVSTVAAGPAAGVDLASPLGRAVVAFGMEQKARLLGAPPQVANPLALAPPYHDTWTEDLGGFVFAAASTRAWRVMLETVYAATRVPIFLRSTLVNRILMEARDSAQAALALAHRLMSVVLQVEVVIDVEFDSHAYQLGGQIMLPALPVDAPLDEEEDEYEEDDDDADLNDAMMDECLTEEEIGGCMLEAEYNGRGGTDACTICLENMAQGSMAAWLFCGHCFHPDCIKKWLRRNASCPVCRLSLP